MSSTPSDSATESGRAKKQRLQSKVLSRLPERMAVRVEIEVIERNERYSTSLHLCAKADAKNFHPPSLACMAGRIDLIESRSTCPISFHPMPQLAAGSDFRAAVEAGSSGRGLQPSRKKKFLEKRRAKKGAAVNAGHCASNPAFGHSTSFLLIAQRPARSQHTSRYHVQGRQDQDQGQVQATRVQIRLRA